jgi:endonuclease/exonuclease/phosphatase family metal-dependent hydrolase
LLRDLPQNEIHLNPVIKNRKNSTQDNTEIHIATFNAENFYILLNKKYSKEGYFLLSEQEYLSMNASIFNPNKERSKIQEIANIILEYNFDLIGLCEIGGMETLENFNRLYLDNRYTPFIFEENSSRGIFVGALIKKSKFPGLKVKNVQSSFSRNLLKIELGKKGGNITVFVVHLKSQLGDDHGIDKRLDEISHLSSLVRHSKCIVMGDFNGILIRGMHQFEYEQFLRLPLCDVLSAVGIPSEKRYTHYYFNPSPHFSQLDYIFCTHDIHVLSASVIQGDIPQTKEERKKLPSDHLFLRALVEIPTE